MGLKLLQSYYKDIVLRARIILALLSWMKYFALPKIVPFLSHISIYFNAFYVTYEKLNMALFLILTQIKDVSFKNLNMVPR